MLFLKFPSTRWPCQARVKENAYCRTMSASQREKLGSKQDQHSWSHLAQTQVYSWLFTSNSGPKSQRRGLQSGPAGTQTKSCKVPLRAEPIWKPSPPPSWAAEEGGQGLDSVHLFLIKACALNWAPALEIPFPSRARPPSHQPPSPLGPAQGEQQAVAFQFQPAHPFILRALGSCPCKD